MCCWQVERHVLRPWGSEGPGVFAAGVTGAQQPEGGMVGDEPWKSEGIMMEGPLGLVGTSDVVLNVIGTRGVM